MNINFHALAPRETSLIPQKPDTNTDLNAKLDDDLKKAEETQKDIKKQKPKLAQALTSKWFKYVIVVFTAIGIGYKMFFAPVPEERKKAKKRTTKSTKTIQEARQNEIASAKVAKTKKGQIVQNNVVSIDEKAIANQTQLQKISVPDLKLPEIPKIPTIEKISIIDHDTTSANERNNKKTTQEYEYVEVEVVENGEKIKKIVQQPKSHPEKQKQPDRQQEQQTEPQQNTATTQQNDVKKKRKIKQKIRDKKGRVKTVSIDVEMTDEEYKEYKEQLKSKSSNAKTDNLPGGDASILSQQSNTRATPETSKTKNKSRKEQNTRNLGSNALDEMFILSGNGPKTTGNKSASVGKKDFILFDGASLAEKEISTSNASANVSRISNLENTIASGKIMEAVLETAINSEAGGTIRAVMSKDVYGEAGNKILIPRGSRLQGSYATTQRTVQTRLLLTWNQVIRPDGVVITMKADTHDQSGKKGIEGDIDTRYGELFKNSLLYSFVTLGTAIAVEKIANIKHATSINSATGTTVTNTSPANAAAQSVIDTAQDIAEKMTDGLTDDVKPIISIPQGTLLKVIANSNVVISSAYKRRTQDIRLD